MDKEATTISAIPGALEQGPGLEAERVVRVRMQTKLIGTFIFLVILPTLVMGKISFDSERETIYREVSQSNLRVAELLAQEVVRMMTGVRDTLTTVALLPEFRIMDTKAMASHLDNLTRRERLKKNHLLSAFHVYDKSGAVLYSSNGYEDDEIRRAWFMGLVKGSMFGHAGAAYIHETYNEPRILLAHVIRDEQYEASGVVIAELDLTALQEIVKPIKIGQSGYAYIVDSLGRVIAHPDPRRVARKGVGSISGTNRAVELALTGADSGVRFAVEAIGGPLEFVDQDGVGQLAAYTNTRKFDMDKAPTWGVVVQQPTAEAYGSLEKIKRRVFMVVLLCIIIASVIGVLIALSITVPLENLVKGVKMISRGDLDHSLTVMSYDEIGSLTVHFDGMRQNLREKINELSTLYSLGQEMCSILDYNRLINIILDDIVAAIGADRGSLMLYDEETRKLKIRVARGLSDDIVQSTEVAEGEGVAGMVLRSRAPILVNDCARDSELARLKSGNVFSGALMSVPLLVQDSMRGVINLSKNEPDSFSPKDLKFFQGLAVQASIALENARLYKLAITDGLTKLYIHRYFQQRLDEEIKRADRYGSEISLIMTDIDHFKGFNDTYGHQQGDNVLKLVAKIMRDSMREVDLVARYGGEEFAIICPEQSVSDVMIPAERLRRQIESAEFLINGKLVPITISIGIATYPKDSDEKKLLIERADQALYHAKESGRNKVCLYGDIKGKVRR